MEGSAENQPQVIRTLHVPTLAPEIQIDDETKTLGVYLELPTASRRRRSLQPSIASDDRSVCNMSIQGDDIYDDDLFDSPRLFTELLTLTDAEKTNVKWKEAARWVRFEEDVEEGGQRWSKPRVSTLLLHSFFELRSYLANGIICLDVDGNSIETIFRNAVNQSSLQKRLSSDKIKQIEETLRSKVVHLFEISKNKESIKNGGATKKNKNDKNRDSLTDVVNIDEESGNGINYKGNRQFMKKLPEGTEAASVMVAEVKYIEKTLCLFIRLKRAVKLGNLTEVSVPTKFIFIIIGPMGSSERHFEIGRSVATLFSDEVFREVAYKGKNKSHLLAGMDEFLDASTLLPPGEWDPAIRIEPPADAPTKETRKKKTDSPTEEEDEEEEESKLREESGLTRSGRLFGGFVNDLKRKIPWYGSDFKDGIALKSVASFFFLYFACLTPIVTFGGLLGEATNNNIAVMESLVAGLICGVVYGFFAGQPLTILGSTGPVLVFETILHQFCADWGWDYLSFRLWIGVWAGLILLLLVAFDASALVCYITRFTEENFATLISLIFIVKAVEKVLKIGQKYPMMTHVDDDQYCNCSLSGDLVESHFNKSDLYDMDDKDLMKEECHALNGTLVGNSCKETHPDVFLLSLMLFFGTFLISTTLKNFKTKSFFPTWARGFVSDFAVILAIVSMTVVDMLVGIHTPKLIVPSEFKPTSPNRGWVINPFNGNPWWTPILAVVPALLACILMFMDQQITSVIINRKEHKLKKGGGYHLDLFIVAILMVINSIMGLPWFVAATVLSINHVNSLTLESETAAPGEKPKFLGVRENRVTHILIFLFIGFSVFMTPVLRMIPMSVLFGVFLYMGIAALNGIQFFDRILIMFMPVKYQPDHPYLRKVPLRKVHLFTYIQLACLVVLWVIKSFQQTSILFPLMLVLMVGVRKLLDYVFTQRELKILDDTLPEYKRIEKIEEEEENDIEEEAKQYKGERLMSIPMGRKSIVNVNDSGPAISITDIDTNKMSSLKVSDNIRQRRRSSILEPIFSTPHHYEGEITLRLPSDNNEFIQ